MSAKNHDKNLEKIPNKSLSSTPPKEEPLYVNHNNNKNSKPDIAQPQGASKPIVAEEHIYHSIDTIYKTPEKELADKVEKIQTAENPIQESAGKAEEHSALFDYKVIKSILCSNYIQVYHLAELAVD